MRTYKVTRNIPCPVKPYKRHHFWMVPAIITVTAASGGEASAYADLVQGNTKAQVWGTDKGAKPNTPWLTPNLAWVEEPYEGEPLELR